MLSTEERRLCPPRPPSSPRTTSRSQTRTCPVLPVGLLAILTCVISSVSFVCAQRYEVPPATLEALSPRGLRVSIPDSPGVELFAFHGSINKPMHALEAGDLSVDIVRKTGNRWVYLNDRVRLKLGDIIYYWTYVQVDGLGYRRDDQTWQVRALVDPAASSSRPATGWTSGSGAEGSDSSPTSGGSSITGSPGREDTGTFSVNTAETDTYETPSRPTNSGGNTGGVSRPTSYYEGEDGAAGSSPSGNFGSNSGGNSGGSRPTGSTGGNSGGGRPVGSNSGSGTGRPSGGNTGGNRRPTGSNGSGSGPTSRPTGTFINEGNTDEYVQSGAGTGDSRPTSSGGDFGGDNYGNYGGSSSSSNNAGDRPTHSQTPAPAQHCVLSTTTVNGRPACKGYVIFDETFKSLDLRRWARDVRIPSHPDFEFCVFTDGPDKLWVHNDALHIRPKLTEDQYGEDFVRTGNLVLEGCTAGPSNAEACSRQAVFSYILPPALSARINTKDSFRFRYGVLEIRAKLPLGDWIYPEISLLPYQEQYGPGISSGRVQLAMARGNRQLRTADGETQLGAKRLEYGVMAGTASKILHRINNRLWADQFHNYTLLWTPETMAFSVDGVELGVLKPETYGGLLHGASGQDPWANGDVLAPFDKEFYLSLGLAVGGVRTFPDDIVTGQEIDKPWGNTDAKALLKFWNAKEQWYPTWGDKSQLIVESIRVTALNH